MLSVKYSLKIPFRLSATAHQGTICRMVGDENSGGNGDAGNRVAFDYIKSQHFRVVRADGAIGGLTPAGDIHFALYTERHPIPRRLVHQMDEGGLGAVLPNETVSRDAIVREMDVDIFVNIGVARSLHQWLGEKIAECENRNRDRSKGN